MSLNSDIRSANFHITSRCNYHCRFCYTQNLPRDEVNEKTGYKIIEQLFELGIEKINFVGGEPLLHPHICEFVKVARKIGFTVCITSNGSLLNKAKIQSLKSYLTWIGISIDSASNSLEKQLGRGNGNHISHSLEIADMIQSNGIKLKVNTTVTRINFKENLRPLLHRLNPDRWKVFQMLHIRGQNDNCLRDLAISQNEFDHFMKIHTNFRLKNGAGPIFESEQDMIDSYFMVFPSGNVMINSGGIYREIPLAEIFENGLDTVINGDKYRSRCGHYNWN